MHPSNPEYFPKLPPHLSTIRAGNRLERWGERRKICIQQRDVLLGRVGALDGVLATLPWARTTLRAYQKNLERTLRTLNLRIDDCNETIEALQATRPGVHAMPRRRGGGV